MTTDVRRVASAAAIAPKTPRGRRIAWRSRRSTVPAGRLGMFGMPAELSLRADAVGGPPGRSPQHWLWAVYAAPTPVLRRAALGLVGAEELARWYASTLQSRFAYLGVRT